MRDLTHRGEFPVASFSTLGASTVDELSTQAERFTGKHEIVSCGADKVKSEIHYAPLSRMALIAARTGTSMLMEIQANPNTYTLFCAKQQHSIETDSTHLIINGRRMPVSSRHVSMVKPGMSFMIDVESANNYGIMLDIDAEYLESIIAMELHENLNTPLEFLPDDTDSNNDIGFIYLLHSLHSQVQYSAPEIRHKNYLRHLEQVLALSLIYTKRNNYSQALANIDEQPIPRNVVIAVDYMHSHAGEPITLKDLAEIAATSQRSLIRGFQKYKNTSPISYLRLLRLERAREDLMLADPDEDLVISIANKWGFYNLGRFAKAYRKRFGENPADTLRHRPGLASKSTRYKN